MKKLLFILLVTGNCLAQSLSFTGNGIDYKFTEDSIFASNSFPDKIESVEVAYFGGGEFTLSIYSSRELYVFTYNSMVKIGSNAEVQVIPNDFLNNQDQWIIETWANAIQEPNSYPPFDLKTTITPKYDYVNIVFK